MKTRLALAVLVLLCFASTAAAQFKAGDWELTLSGSGASSKEFDSGNFAGNVGVGWFATDNLELGLRQGISYASTDDADVFLGETRGAVDWNFNLGKFVPFVGVSLGASYGDGDTQFVIGPEAGLRYFISTDTFIVGSVGYEARFESFNDIGDGFDNGGFVFGLGLGFKW